MNNQMIPDSQAHPNDRLVETFADLIDVMDIAMWELDLEYRIVACNRKARQIYGEKVLGSHCFQVADGLDSVCDRCPVQKVYSGHQNCRSEHTRTDVAGRTIYVDHIATPIKDQHGKLSGALELIIDITQHKVMEQEITRHRNRLEEIVLERTRALKESEERYRALYEHSKKEEELYRSLLDSSADGIAIYDLEGRAQYINPSFSETFGWRLEELKDRRIPYVPESEDHISMEKIRRVIEDGERVKNFRTQRLTKDGRCLDVDISASRYTDHQNKPAGMLVVIRDISQQKALELQLQQSQKMKAIGTLAGGVAHDFNNILMGIQGRASLMLSEIEPYSPLVEHLSSIEAYVHSATDLTKQLLGYARGGKYEVKTANLTRLIDKSLQMFGRTRKEINIHKEFESDLWNVDIDAQQIEQVLLNLYVNAIQAMPGGGDFYLRTQNTILRDNAAETFKVSPGRYVKMSVTDTGVGMDQDTLDRVFDPFFTTRARGRGTGLGLASAYGIVKNHHGVITADSVKGQGTTFTIYLPASSKEVMPEQKESRKVLSGAETILLLDDEQMVLDVAKPMLTKLGYRVYLAGTGEQAIEIYRRHPHEIHLAIIDLIMPGMNGGAVFDQLRQINPEAKVLLSSGYSIDGEAAEIMSRGCNGFIQKPFGLKELSQKIRTILD
jgi:two-component system, cell cycle sensor histidine kinase and response regulator CckA